MHRRGKRSTGSTRGQFCLKIPCGYQIWSDESLTRVQSIAEVTRGSNGVNQRSILLEMPYGYWIWSEESQTKTWCIAGVKGHSKVILGQPEVNLPRNEWSICINFSQKKHWPVCSALVSQRSERGYPGSTRGQI